MVVFALEPSSQATPVSRQKMRLLLEPRLLCHPRDGRYANNNKMESNEDNERISTQSKTSAMGAAHHGSREAKAASQATTTGKEGRRDTKETSPTKKCG